MRCSKPAAEPLHCPTAPGWRKRCASLAMISDLICSSCASDRPSVRESVASTFSLPLLPAAGGVGGGASSSTPVARSSSVVFASSPSVSELTPPTAAAAAAPALSASNAAARLAARGRARGEAEPPVALLSERRRLLPAECKCGALWRCRRRLSSVVRCRALTKNSRVVPHSDRSNMLGGASQTVSKIRIKCNGT